MTKRVLDVGNCSPDHAAIRHLIESRFGSEVIQAHNQDEALSALKAQSFDLVLINRKLDRDNSDGLEIIKQIKGDPNLCDTPVMMITNYAEHQEAAVAAGAQVGFGKLELAASQTIEKLGALLS